MNDELSDIVSTYLRQCFTEGDKGEIQKLIDDEEYEELKSRMQPRIAFGTSGLRATMEAGFARINELTIYQASVGLRNYVLKNVPNAAERGIVIGHDHRHHSSEFAEITRQVFKKSMKVYHFGDKNVFTPLVHFMAACGVMITASHNPKQDNGYKVYWENACAIIPPHDHGIADEIDAGVLQPADDVTSAEGEEQDVWALAIEGYKADCLLSIEGERLSDSLRFCYTPMHGVGAYFAKLLIASIGSDGSMTLVKQQESPDPDFSTVAFPNPEEKGALDLAISVATENGLPLIIANDPDADRLGAAEFVDGTWRILTGNEIGVLLASEMIRRTSKIPRRAMLSSAVSSQMLGTMCQAEGIHWEETLTGFKWLGNRALTLAQEGYAVVYAYEEALGFMPFNVVYDKDGILSMCIMLLLADRLYKEKQTLSSEIARLYTVHGAFASANWYFKVEPAKTVEIMTSLRQPCYPKTLGSRSITRVRDLTAGYDSSTQDHMPTLPTSHSSEMITFWLSGPGETVVMTIRGSGTEPKLKYYIEAKALDLDKAQQAANQVAADLRNEWFRQFSLD